MPNPSVTRPQTLNDLMGNVSLTEAARAAMSVADAVQNFPNQGVRLAAIVSVFTLAMEITGLNPAEVVGRAKNVVNQAEGRRPEFRAVQSYLAVEVFGAR